MTAHSAPAWYIYAVVPEGAPVPRCEEAILPGADLVMLSARAAASERDEDTHSGAPGLAALASLVPRALFGSDGVESRAGDPDWIAARAAAHHAVVASLAAQCTCLPLGFGTLFSSMDSLRRWLAEHEVGLRYAMAAVGGRVEWSLNLVENVAAHAAWVAAQDATVLALAQSVASAGPGTAFLLQRRLDRAVDAARAAHCRQEADDMSARLAALSPPIQAEPGGNGASWSMLAAKGDDIAAALQPAVDALSGTGLELRVTGPWPPYAFARAAWQDCAHG